MAANVKGLICNSTTERHKQKHIRSQFKVSACKSFLYKCPRYVYPTTFRRKLADPQPPIKRGGTQRSCFLLTHGQHLKALLAWAWILFNIHLLCNCISHLIMPELPLFKVTELAHAEAIIIFHSGNWKDDRMKFIITLSDRKASVCVFVCILCVCIFFVCQWLKALE